MKSTLKKVSGQTTLKSILALVMALLLPVLNFAQSSDVVEAPKEFNPARWDWVFWLYMIAGLLLILVIARIFDITKLTEAVTGKKVLNWNNINGIIALIVLIAGAIGVWYELKYHGPYVMNSNAASEHGKALDSMFNITFGFTFAVFIITQICLFWFTFRYRYNDNRKALYYYHNNKLEIIWTVIPSIVLTFLVLRGFNTWSKITNSNPKDAIEVEVVAQQFQWTARYGGADNQLGKFHFTFIDDKNSMGLAIEGYVDSLLLKLETNLKNLNTQKDTIAKTVTALTTKYNKLKASRPERGYEKEYKELRTALCDAKSGALLSQLELEIRRINTTIERIKKIRVNKDYFNGKGSDDVIAQEICLIKNKTYKFKFRSKDVLHSAWIPEFRAQMNCVPGMPTQFVFTPIKTTVEARKEKGNAKFNYYLYCNKICGPSHHGMKITVTVVNSEQEFNEWMNKQATAVPKPKAIVPEMKKDGAKDSTGNAQVAAVALKK